MEPGRQNDDLSRTLRDYRLITAEILYHLPDHPRLLQTFVWQDYDLAPIYPVLGKFLGFWTQNIEGKLHSVYVARQKLLIPGRFTHVSGEFLVN